MTNQQVNDKTVFLLSVLTFVVTLVTISYMIISGNYKEENCWDKYSTEQEAIMNCEGEQ
jgi:hypothetical protein